MKNRKILALILTFALLITQFSMMGTVSAATALSGRSDFAKGVGIHRSQGYTAYRNTTKTIADAKALGSNFIRTNQSSWLAYDIGVVEAAAKEGLQVFMTTGFSHQSNGSAIPASEIDIAGITSTYTAYATALYGKVAYYQLGNELDNVYMKSGSGGRYASNYNDVSGVAVAIYAAHNAIKAADPNAKTVVNFSPYHYGFFEAVKAVNIDSRTGRVATSSTPSQYVTHADWDINGLDLYVGWEGAISNYTTVISNLTSTYPDKPVIVCEANVRATGVDGNGTVSYNGTPEWLENFITYCYGNSSVKGFFVYELYDEPAYEYVNGSYSFTEESHFGLIDKNGNKKAMYETVRSLYGGSGVASNFGTPSALADSENVLKLSEYENWFGAYYSNAISNGWLPGSSETLIQLGSETNFNLYDYIEFDYYVDNLTNFQSRVTGFIVELVHYSGAQAKSADFRSYLTKNGWNHVRIPITAFSGEDWITDRAQQIRFRITMPASSTAAYDIYALGNVCATKNAIVIPSVNNTYTTKDYIAGIQYKKDFAPGENPYSSGKHFFRLSKSLDTSVADHIEMDIYASEATDQTSKFWVADDRESSANRGRYIIPILNKGWNHIVFDAYNPDYKTGSYSFKNYNFVYPFIDGGLYSSSSTGGQIIIANISVTQAPWGEAPEMPSVDGMHTFASGIKYTGTLGSSAISNSWLPGQSYSQIDFDRMNLRNYDFVELDYYVENITNFKARTSAVNVIVVHYSGGRDETVNIIDMITESGWNHIAIPVTAFIKSGEEWVIENAGNLRFRTTVSASNTGSGDHYTVANICATKGEWLRIPEIQESEGMRTFVNGNAYTGTLGSSAINDGWLPGQSYSQINFDRTNLRIYDYVEFDYYVQNIDNFKARTSAVSVIIVHYSGGADQTVNIIDMITQSGWNHIKIAIPSFATSGREWVVENAGNLRIKTTMSESSTGASDHYTVANVIMTKDPINLIPEINNTYTTMDYIPGAQHTITLAPGENPVSSSKHFFRLSKALDTANANHIEMDIYVSADTDCTSSIWVAADRESSTVRGRYAIPLLNAGWNHIVIDANVTIQREGGFTFKDYNFVYPFLQGAFYSADHPTGGTVRIANISVTCDITAPTDVMSDNIGFTGNELEFVKFDEYGMYELTFETSKDISDTKMIELDFFVSNTENETATIEIMDAEGNCADYEFTGISAGWNHLAVRIADLNQNADNSDDVDFTDIAYFTVYGVANTDVVLANVYAADYVEGDANRDGVFDMKDIVRAKRLAAGITNDGNKLAVSGADYEINALDLTNLIRDIIDTLFS